MCYYTSWYNYLEIHLYRFYSFVYIKTIVYIELYIYSYVSIVFM